MDTKPNKIGLGDSVPAMRAVSSQIPFWQRHDKEVDTKPKKTTVLCTTQGGIIEYSFKKKLG